MKRCFFIGHWDASEAIYQKLLASVERHIKEFGVEEFLVGRYGNFDALAARAVLQAKEKYPAIRLTLLLPYHPALKTLEMPGGFDGIYYPFDSAVPSGIAIIRANEKAIRMCDFLIAYAYHPGKSTDFLNYAKRRKKPGCIDNLAGQA